MADLALTEVWRPALGFEDRYEVSSLGRVASLYGRRRTIVRPAHNYPGGHLYVTFHRRGQQSHRMVHRLVCEAFHGPRPEGAVTRHLDGDCFNNTPDNVVWGTPSENNYDRVAHGKHPNAEKTHCKNNHPLSGDNLYINATSGARQCRTCQGVSKRAYAKRKRATSDAR